MLKFFLRAKFFAVSFVLVFMSFLLFSQDQENQIEQTDENLQEEFQENRSAKIKLPPITTYIQTTLENKITYTHEEIVKHNFQDLPQLLSDSGIQILSYGDYGLEKKPSVRGFTDETVRVVIDGVCVNNEQTGVFDFSSVNLNNIEKIEIIKGGYTEGTEDEGAVGGVIYITAKKSFSKEFQTDTKIKTFFNSQTPVDLFSQSMNFCVPILQSAFLNFSAAATNAYNNFQNNNSLVQDIHSFFSLTNYFGNGNSLSISNQNYAGKKALPGTEFSKNNEKLDDFNNNFYVKLFTPDLFSLFNLTNIILWQSNLRKYVSVAEKSVHFLNKFSYSANVDFFDRKNIKQKAGITFEYTNLDSTNDGIQHKISGVLKETTQLRINQIFCVNIPFGVKFSNKNFALLPKFAFCADISKISEKLPFIITFNVYRLIQFPTMDDLYWKGENFHGNADLKPENGWGSDFSVDYSKNFLHGQIVKIDVDFFANYYQNKIQWTFFENVWQPQNVASAFYFGIDFSVNVAFWENRVKINLNGEYLYTKLLNKANEYTYGKKIMWTPDFTAAASFMLNFDYWNFNFAVNYVGKRYVSNMNVDFLKPYVLLSCGGEFIPVKQIVLYVRVDNILNTKYESIENYKTPGISLTAGIKFSGQN